MALPKRPRPPLVRLSIAVHAAALATVVVAPRRWPQAVAVIAANHLVLALAGMLPRASGLGPNLNRLPGDVAAGRVGLTFDDGPDPDVTPAVLDVLSAHDATASFFCIGQRAARYPELVSEIVRQGHRVENHTWSHPHSFAFSGQRRLGREIDLAQELLGELSGRSPHYFRAPAGVRNPFLDGVLARRGLCLAAWTRRGFDTRERRPEKVLARLRRGLREGDVLLLHDGSAARSARGRAVVLDVLPALLDSFAERRLVGVALPDVH